MFTSVAQEPFHLLITDQCNTNENNLFEPSNSAGLMCMGGKAGNAGKMSNKFKIIEYEVYHVTW